MISEAESCHQGVTKCQTYQQTQLSSSLELLKTHTTHQVSLNKHQTNSHCQDNNLTCLTLNVFSKGQNIVPDLLQLMKIHIVALQDCGLLFQSKQGKAQFGSYKLEMFKFGEGKNDTLAFMIDEGIINFLRQEKPIITNEAARSLILVLPSILKMKEPFYIINTYAPPSPKDKPKYITALMNMCHQLNISATNSMIMGYLNDFTSW